MFQDDIEHKQFKPSEHGGFKVVDFTVFDIALTKLELVVYEHVLSAKQEKIVLIEFARNDYQWPLSQFGETFLFDAYFLYLTVDLEKCKKRIHYLITYPITNDNFYVSENIFNSYYNKDDGGPIPKILASDFGIAKEWVKAIDNNGSLSASIVQIYHFVDTMFRPLMPVC